MIIVVGAEDERFRAQLAELLEENGHRVVQAAAVKEAAAAVRSSKARMLVAAFSAAAGSGLVRGLRGDVDFVSFPVLCVDPKATAAEIVDLLDAGADDAIAHRFQPAIFLARVRTLLRRAVLPGEAAEETVTVLNGGPIELRLLSRAAFVRDKTVELTRLEFDLLAHFLKNPGRAFKREELLCAVWNYPNDVETRTLDKHVESLRRKIGPCAELIQTVHGVGYRFSAGSARR